MKLRHVLLFVVFLSPPLYAIEHSELQDIEKRIQPIGQVHIEDSNQTSVNVGSGAKSIIKTKKKPGQVVYENHCIVCHRDGLAGAPKFHNEKEWKPRLSGRTIDDLVASSIKGLNAMPAKGTCNECSDADLKNAIQYMLPYHD